MTECQRQQNQSGEGSSSPTSPLPVPGLQHTQCVGAGLGGATPAAQGSQTVLFRSGALNGGSSAPPSVCEGHGHSTHDSQAAGPGYAHQVGLPGSGQRTWPRTLELHRGAQQGWGSANLATQGPWKRFRVTCAAIKDRSMVSLLAWLLLLLRSALQSSLPLLLSSPSPLRVQSPSQLSRSGHNRESSGPGDRDLSSPGVAARLQPLRRPR